MWVSEAFLDAFKFQQNGKKDKQILSFRLLYRCRWGLLGLCHDIFWFWNVTLSCHPGWHISIMNIRSKRLVSGADGCARVCQPQTHWSLPSALRQGCLPWSSSFIHLQNTSLWFCVIVKDLTMEVSSFVIAEEKTWTQSFALQEGAYVAQYKFTVLLMPNGPHKITGAQAQQCWVNMDLCETKSCRCGC